MKKVFYLLLICLTLSSCHLLLEENSSGNNPKWSQLLTTSIVDRWDSIARENKHKWTYDIAFLVRAVYMSDENKYLPFLKAYVDPFIAADGSIRSFDQNEYNLDRMQAGRNLFYLYKKTGEEKYKKAIEYQLKQMKTQPRNKEGGFWHKKIYPNQMWLDGIYMACPFMAQYAKEFNQPLWFDEAVKQITLVYNNTLDVKTGLLYHAWDESRQEKWSNTLTGQSPNFWSRAMGWYAMALVDVLDFLPENHPKRAQLIQILQDISRALAKVRNNESGLWYQVLNKGDKEGNYLEASGSAMFAYTFAKASKKGYLDKSYYELAQRAQQGIIDKLIEKDDHGYVNLTHVCGSCGLGGNPYRDGSYEYYINEKISVNDPKGVAPFILASMELENAGYIY
jgi:unsaturated rhamnogalacturonyl hydrolase